MWFQNRRTKKKFHQSSSPPIILSNDIDSFSNINKTQSYFAKNMDEIKEENLQNQQSSSQDFPNGFLFPNLPNTTLISQWLLENNNF